MTKPHVTNGIRFYIIFQKYFGTIKIQYASKVVRLVNFKF
jgi:hypothetical protein